MNKLSTKTKKNLFTLLAGIICCMATFTVTSCSVDDSAIYPDDEEIDYDLTGSWVNVIKGSDLLDGDYSIKFMITFDNDGVIRTSSIDGFEGDDVEYWDIMNRHYVYMSDKSTQTLTVVGSLLFKLPEFSNYEVVDGQLIINNPEDGEKYIYHRATFEDKVEFGKFDKHNGGDCIGTWVRTYKENGLTTYEVADINSLTTFTRYTVNANGEVQKTKESYYMDEDPYMDGTKRILLYTPNYEETVAEYWWKVEGKNLYLGNFGEQETRFTYHMLTKEEYKMFMELDKTAAIVNLKEMLVGDWETRSAGDEPQNIDEMHFLTYNADGTMSYTPSLDALRNLGIWGHNFKGNYTINGNFVEHQVQLADKNILFTQNAQVLDIDQEDAKVISNAETFIDGTSRHVVKDSKEEWSRPMDIFDYPQEVTGHWTGVLTSGTIEGWEKKTKYLVEFKDDGTFTMSERPNNQEAWKLKERTLSEYFMIGNVMYMRWQDAGSDEIKYQCWLVYIFGYEDNELWMYTRSKNSKGEVQKAELQMNITE